MDKTGEDWNGLNLGKFEKRRPTFFQIYISLYQNVIYRAGKSFSVVKGAWFCKWKTLALLIWRLELIINKLPKIAWPSTFKAWPNRKCLVTKQHHTLTKRGWCEVLFSTPLNYMSVSPSNGNGPTQGQRKTLTRVGIEPMTFGLDHSCSTDWATRSDGSRSCELKMLNSRQWIRTSTRGYVLCKRWPCSTYISTE